MTRLKIAAGNWKMNKTFGDAVDTIKALISKGSTKDVLTIIGSPYVYLSTLQGLMDENTNLHIAAQNVYHEEKGAYTGEISVDMLQSIGIHYVIVGHSERREYFNEGDDTVGKKVDLLLSRKMTPIFCCGEPLGIRKNGSHVEYVKSQISNSLFHLSADDVQKIIIAYEPIWAIGTGETASPAQAQEMHAAIRVMLADKYGDDVAQSISILYGGSVKPSNAEELFSQTDVDGGLVGGASLDAESFHAIMNSF